MRKLVYDVAMSLDNFISHEDGGVEGFRWEGDHATEYLDRLKGYETGIMGRKTYEWGYPFGVVPGKRAPLYAHMRHYIFSKTLRFGPDAEVEVIDSDEAAMVRRLAAEDGTDIYLCGGGDFAGFLLDHGLIDQVVIKLNPVVFGHGVRIFGRSTRNVSLELVSVKSYSNGVILPRYDIRYE